MTFLIMMVIISICSPKLYNSTDLFVGKFKSGIETVPTPLEEEEENLEGLEQALFLQFLQKMIQWRPEDRSSVKELMDDPWLQMSNSSAY
jgi:hypothetical protein